MKPQEARRESTSLDGCSSSGTGNNTKDSPGIGRRKYECCVCRKAFNNSRALEKHVPACKGNPDVPVQVFVHEGSLRDADHSNQYIKQEFTVSDAAIDETMSPHYLSVTSKRETFNSSIESTDMYFEELMPAEKNLKDSTTDHESSSLNNLAIKAKIASGEYKVTNKRGRSRVWGVFGKIEDQNGEEIPNMVACRTCGNIYKHNEATTSNLVRHRCYNVAIQAENDAAPCAVIGVDDKNQSVRVFTQWVIENCRPLQIVEDSGLLNIAKHLISIGAKYGRQAHVESVLPHPTTLISNVKKLYDVYLYQLKDDIGSVKNVGFGLTADLRTDNHLRKSFIILTIHFMKSSRLLSKFLALHSMEGENCATENIERKVRNILSDFDCDLNNKAVMVTDKSPGMEAAFSSFPHIFCVNNLIDCALQKSVDEMDDLKELCRKCSKLENYFRTSETTSKPHSVSNSYNSARWNSLFHVLRFVQKREGINQTLQAQNGLSRLEDIDLVHIASMVKVLEPFEEAFKELGRQSFPTMHLVIVHINRLKRQCTEDPSDRPIIRDFKAKLALNLQSIVLANLTVYHKIALFLFPPANKLNQFDAREKLTIKEECKRMMKMYQEDVQQSEDPKAVAPGLSSRNLDLLSAFIELPELLLPEAKLNKELIAYENTNVMFYDDFNILQWWELNKNEFPLLYRVSCVLLATPASSTASERVFSLARNFILEDEMNENTLNQILFLHVNTDKTDISNELTKELIA